MMDWLITGSTGFLGSRAVQELGKEGQVAAPTHRELDITDEGSCLRLLEQLQPRTVFHASAISMIPQCEADPDLSQRVNVQGAVNMAKACKAVGAKLLFCSTDQVYTGCGGSEPLPEAAPLNPLNVYARHKLEAENRLLELCPDTVCLRLTWMFDLPVAGLRTNPNLVTDLLKTLVTGEKTNMPHNDHRAMTYGREVVRHLPAMAAAPGGVYNYGSSNPYSTYETARRTARLLGAEERFMQLVSPVEWAGGVERNLTMNIEKAKSVGAAFGSTLEGVEAMLREYGIKA